MFDARPLNWFYTSSQATFIERSPRCRNPLGCHARWGPGIDLGQTGPVTKYLAKIVAWITSGYPEGVPGPDRVPLFALLKRRLTDDEVTKVALALNELGEFDDADIGVLITEVTDELPTPEDVERVRQRLADHGWPLDEPGDDAEDTP